MENSADDRSRQYKNTGKDKDAGRRRRNEATVELRRRQRDLQLNKRRNIDDVPEEESELSDIEKPAVASKYTIAECKSILMGNPSIEQVRDVFHFLRKLLSRSKNPPIDEVVREGLVLAFVQGLQVQDRTVQYEAAWALTNVVSSEPQHTEVAARCGSMEGFIKLTQTDDMELAEQCVWGLANMIGDGPAYRDLAIQQGMLDLVTNLLKKLDSLKLSFVRTLAWTCSNLCRYKDFPLENQHLERLLPCLTTLLRCDDDNTRSDACWGLTYLANHDNHIDAIVQANVLPDTIALLRGKDSLAIPAIRLFGSLASGNDAVTQSVVDSGVLTDIHRIFANSRNSATLKEACWLVSNVFGGTTEQIKAGIDAELVPQILYALRNGEYRVQLEAVWCVSNLAHSSSPQQVMKLVEADVWNHLVPTLDIRHVEFIGLCLAAIRDIFDSVTRYGEVILEDQREAFEGAGGLDKLEELQQHENEDIYELAHNLLKDFFPCNDENADRSAVMDQEPPVFNF